MGFDNECTLNIQSLPGEYFCPVCRTLIYPHEALQAQCTHLYCKPCLAYIMATTRACPYDGYLVTEADSKPLLESNKSLAEIIGKVQVYCLYHRSGCQWQGTLSDCINHYIGCSFGNSPVVCNRCGTQIVHRQVQEHAQTCPGLQPQGQQVENAQIQALSAALSQSATQDSSAANSSISAVASTSAAGATVASTSTVCTTSLMSAPAVASAATSATNAAIQALTPGSAVAYLQPGMQTQTSEQWYQQQQLQYQQYYQQYPGYDPCQQQYQHYGQYQLQAYQQYSQPHMQVAQPQVIQGQPQNQAFMQPHSHGPHPQSDPQSQVQSTQPQLQQQHVPLTQPQPQAQPQPQLQSHPQSLHQTQPLGHAQPTPAHNVPVQQCQQVPHQSQVQATNVSAHPGLPHYPQLQPHPQVQQPQLHASQQQPLVPAKQQPTVLPQQLPPPHMQHQQPQPPNQPCPVSQSQLQQPHMLQQPCLQPQPHAQPLPQPQPQHPGVHGVIGHQSYPQHQLLQQTPHGVQQQRPMHHQQPGLPPQPPANQFPIHQPQQMRPAQTHVPMQAPQYPAMQPHAQAPFPNAAPQPQAQHLTHQSGQQMHQPVGMLTHPQNQTLPQQQAQGQYPPVQQHHQGAFPSQPHSQQSLRPPVQPYMLSNALPIHVRSVVPNQAMLQPAQHSSAKPIQSGVNQHSPNQNYLAGQHGSIQLSQLSNFGSQGSLPSLSHSGPDVNQMSVGGSELKSAVLEKAAGSKTSQVPVLEAEAATGNADGSEASRSIELVNSNNDGGSISMTDRLDEIKEKSETKENKDVSMLKQVKGTATDFQLEVMERSDVSAAIEGDKEVQKTECKQIEKSNSFIERVNTDLLSDGHGATQPLPDTNKKIEGEYQVSCTRGHSIGNAAGNMHAVHPMSYNQQLQDGVDHEKKVAQSVHHDRGLSQLPSQQLGPVGPQGIPLVAPLHGQEKYASQTVSYGPPNMADPAMGSQRPTAPDKMLQQNLTQAGSSQDRMFQEPFQHQPPMHAPPIPPGQLRTPGHPENVPYPGQAPVVPESFLSSGAKPHYGSNLPPKNIEESNLYLMHSQSHGHPPHTVGPRAPQTDPLSRSVIGGHVPRSFDPPRGPHFGYENQASQSGPINKMEGPGYYDGRQLESHKPIPGENAPYGQQNVVELNMMKMNGLSCQGPVGAMHDSAFSHGLPNDRFQLLPEERLKALPEEGFRTPQNQRFGPIAVHSGRHNVNRGEFVNLKMFPRHGHLDIDGARFNAYGHVGRQFDRGQHFAPDGGLSPLEKGSFTSFFLYQSDGRFPASSGGSELGCSEVGGRQRAPMFDEHLLGKRDAGAYPESLRPFPEFGHPHFDNFPPIRNPGIPDGPGHFHMKSGHLRKEIDPFDVPHSHWHAADPVVHGLATNIQGAEPYGARNLPDHLRYDSAGHGPLRGGELASFGGYDRMSFGDSGFPINYSLHGLGNLHSDMDSFEHMRKRKHGSIGWCRICKVDCETVEGLDLHSQTKDHQNMAMEIVLRIKKDITKKQKKAPESEDASKSRQAGTENRGNWC